MTTDPYTFTLPSVDAPCPHVPPGATEWEALEVTRHWRNALRALHELQGTVGKEADRLLLRGDYAVAPADSGPYHHRLTTVMPNDVAEATTEMVALTCVLEGVVHRQAIDRLAKYEVVDEAGRRWAGPYRTTEAAELGLALLYHEDANARGAGLKIGKVPQ